MPVAKCNLQVTSLKRSGGTKQRAYLLFHAAEIQMSTGVDTRLPRFDAAAPSTCPVCLTKVSTMVPTRAADRARVMKPILPKVSAMADT